LSTQLRAHPSTRDNSSVSSAIFSAYKLPNEPLEYTVNSTFFTTLFLPFISTLKTTYTTTL
jgi:hypothetical protein